MLMGNTVGSPKSNLVTPYRLSFVDKTKLDGECVRHIRTNQTFHNTPTNLVITPEYISGYVDGEGSFLISFSPRQKFSVGLEVRPSFSVSQRSDRSRVLREMHSYFNCGSIRKSRKDFCDKYEVRSVKDLCNVIIPHFLTYPLLSEKQREVELFAQVCELVKKGEHRNKEGIVKIIHLSCQMNVGGSRRYLKRELLARLKI